MRKKKKLTEREKKFAEGIKSLRFLIADPSSSRKSFRSLLSHYGIKSGQIEVTETLSDSITAIQTHRPNVLFADLSVGEHQGLSLLEHQRLALAVDEPRIFFLSTSKDSKLIFSGAAEESVDAVITKPFTFESLDDIFVEHCSQRLCPTEYQQAMQLGRAHLDSGNFSQALAHFRHAKTLDKHPIQAWAHEGRALLASRQSTLALQSFEAGLKLDNSHYRCLVGALECCIDLGFHEKGYELGRVLTSSHTVPLQKIPELIRLSVLSGKFSDVLGFFDYADAILEVYPSASAPLAAGLVVCGIYFARQGQRAEAVDAFRKAEVACRKHPKIQKRLLCAMIHGEFTEEIPIVTGRMPAEVKDSVDVRIAELLVMNRRALPITTLQHATNLYRQGVRARELFEILLKRSVELKRSEANIEDILHSATKAFPDLAGHFETLLARPD